MYKKNAGDRLIRECIANFKFPRQPLPIDSCIHLFSGILLVHLYHWRWDHYFVSKRREPGTQWRGVILLSLWKACTPYTCLRHSHVPNPRVIKCELIREFSKTLSSWHNRLPHYYILHFSKISRPTVKSSSLDWQNYGVTKCLWWSSWKWILC